MEQCGDLSSPNADLEYPEQMLESDHTKDWQQELSRDASENNIITRRYRDEKPPTMDSATPG